MTITRKGNVVAPEAAHSIIPAGAYKIRSWENKCSPRTSSETFASLRESGYYYESVFTSTGYVLFVYKTKEERRACFNLTFG